MCRLGYTVSVSHYREKDTSATALSLTHIYTKSDCSMPTLAFQLYYSKSGRKLLKW